MEYEIRRRVEEHLADGTSTSESSPSLDLASPEAEAAIRAVTGLVLEIRGDIDSRLARKVRLYERTLGLAVIPVLIRRALIRRRARTPLARRNR